MFSYTPDSVCTYLPIVILSRQTVVELPFLNSPNNPIVQDICLSIGILNKDLHEYFSFYLAESHPLDYRAEKYVVINKYVSGGQELKIH